MNTAEFLATIPPWAAMPPAELDVIAASFVERVVPSATPVFRAGNPAEGLFVIVSGQVQIIDSTGSGETLALLGPRNTFGERGLIGDGTAQVSAIAITDATLLMLPAPRFMALVDKVGTLHDFFARRRPARPAVKSLAETRVAALMSTDPLTIAPATPIADAARMLRDRKISSVLVTENGSILGIVTVRDMTGRVVAAELDPRRPVAEIMTTEPLTLPADALGSDVLHAMVEQQISHVPIVGPAGVAGIVTKTDLTRFQAETSADLIGDLAAACDVPAMKAVTARIPKLLAQLVGAGNRHEVVTRLITDIADAVTRRLLRLAEGELGAPPVPYLWLACGSQGRREQTGVSDQDNCLILDDAATKDDDAYFAALARFVADGLDACGYVYCPGEMMATNPRWRQPVAVWRRYFTGWIDSPDPMAQMLASVMFDLRPIGGTASLHAGLQTETLEAASRNSIFVAHMVSNSLKHAPPLNLLRGIATLRSGEHRNALDMKLNGVVPIVDLGRIYALRGRLTPVNTRARLEAAQAAGVISDKGGHDLIDAYDLIAQMRLEHQARQVREGERPDNFMRPAVLSEFERSHLRNAFVVVRQMQAAATQGRGVL
ncbi:DUF294 nucleotidyltransferase-like domain-containing protein [Acuticoccus sediminis]|uniref:DUF294 nucleotidyltransferase-like domain-containing protein n=1 Tax=Acuticoccus sediminis TaxID=2184697 RepID=UPI001CFDC833|nr:DUF294 nucleotidyltransferase-like domain-containing protein [Acuticoccus sediminis]